MNDKIAQIISLYNGSVTSNDIAKIVGVSPRYVRRIAKKYDLPRLKTGARNGENNHRFVSGRRVDPDGYALVTAPLDHPYARQRTNRRGKLIFEHRLVMEKKIGRCMLPDEVIDHIDGLTLNNTPENLRIFPQNGKHLEATISGKKKNLSKSGRQNIRNRLSSNLVPVDTYGLRRKRGDVRLRQCLLAWLKFDKDSPCLFGTHYWLKKAGISDFSRSSLEHALACLYQRYEQDLAL